MSSGLASLAASEKRVCGHLYSLIHVPSSTFKARRVTSSKLSSSLHFSISLTLLPCRFPLLSPTLESPYPTGDLWMPIKCSTIELHLQNLSFSLTRIFVMTLTTQTTQLKVFGLSTSVSPFCFIRQNLQVLGIGM